jgi:hypothetical protein
METFMSYYLPRKPLLLARPLRAAKGPNPNPNPHHNSPSSAALVTMKSVLVVVIEK